MEISCPSLEHLPTELLTRVFRFLDPISLIAASQTNTHFRRLIHPTRVHFEERLLALECRESLCGVTPTFSATDNTLSPDWSSTEWEQLRWACPGCLQLLPHTAFDNGSLLRLAYRKPLPHTPAANHLTSWEATEFGLHKGKPIAAEYARSKRLRKRYKLALSNNLWDRSHVPADIVQARFEAYQECDFDAFQDMTLTGYKDMNVLREKQILIREVFLIEAQHCGYKRRLRRCLECQYKLHRLRRHPSGTGGTPTVPIVESRHIKIPSALDRYFPGFTKVLESKRPSTNIPAFKIYNPGHEAVWFTLQMIRCPGCSQWKEMRAFRTGQVSDRWVPEVNTEDPFVNWNMVEYTDEFVNNLRCHHCYIQKHGREAFGNELFRYLNHFLSFAKWKTHGNLHRGWRDLDPYSLRPAPKDLARRVLAISRAHRADVTLSWFSANQAPVEYVPATEDGLSNYNISANRFHFNQWVELREELDRDHQLKWIRERDDYFIWLRYYDDIEEHAYWLNRVAREVCGEEKNQKVGALIDWALEDSQHVMPLDAM